MSSVTETFATITGQHLWTLLKVLSPPFPLSKLGKEGFFIDLWLAVSYQAKDSRGGFGIFCFSMGSFLLERVVL